jgi:hypothetical protein
MLKALTHHHLIVLWEPENTSCTVKVDKHCPLANITVGPALFDNPPPGNDMPALVLPGQLG